MITPDAMPLVLYALSSAVGVIGLLLAVIWGITRSEVKASAEALEKKASAEALKESKENAAKALADVKAHFSEQLTRQHNDYHDRLEELRDKQDREIDWLKAEMDKIISTVTEMRKESTQSSQAIMQQLQALAGMIGSVRSVSRT